MRCSIETRECLGKTISCPWCKTTQNLRIVLKDWGFIANLSYRVICAKCGVSGPEDHIEIEAIKKWNSREQT